MDEWERDEIDDLFDQLDKIVEAAEKIKNKVSPNFQHLVKADVLELMREEAPEFFKVKLEESGRWKAEIKYHGINFFSIGDKNLPEPWKR